VCGFVRVVFDFVDVVPGGWVEDVGVAFDFALRKNREKLLRGLESSWA